MKRLVSLLLVACFLAAVSLAQPAQAQWYRGLPYYPSSNSQSSQPGTSVTATINYNDNGHINITSTPTSGYPGYGTGGTYSGNIGVYYVWGGGAITSDMLLSMPESCEATGSGNSNSGGNSMAGGAYGNFSSGSSGWASPWSYTATKQFYAGDTPTSQQLSLSIGGNVSAYYNSSYPGVSTIITADVTFADPATTP